MAVAKTADRLDSIWPASDADRLAPCAEGAVIGFPKAQRVHFVERSGELCREERSRASRRARAAGISARAGASA
jgi:hypothetical protein